MNPNNLLEISKNNSNVAFHKFVLLSNGRESDLFCFFEGIDSQYYSLRIKQFIKRNYHPILCGNKDSVLKIYERFQINEDYKNFNKAFFIDRDFDDLINNPEIYETPSYSIENFYVNQNTIIEILKNEFRLLETDNEYSILLELFDNELETFNRETLLFNAWYATLKRKKNRENLKTTGVNLDEKLPKGFLCLKIGKIESDYNFDKIMQKFPDAISITVEEVNQVCQDLTQMDLSKRLRGKFQIWFLYEFLKFIIDDANNKKTILSKKTKFKVDKSLILSQISQYAMTPQCLIDYLGRVNQTC